MSTHEQWDVVSSVGFTALAVAAGRAFEHGRDDRIVEDPYAAALVEAAASPEFQAGAADGLSQRMMSDYVGVRSRFFDEFFLRATAAGARQVVILASGLDTRAFRLAWPRGVRVFEIDQPKVLEFKEDSLQRAGAQHGAEWHPLPVDLRDDWAGTLREAGFDVGVPTAWLAEGLLPYLPAAAEAQLLETVHRFSAPGSRIAVEAFGDVRNIVDDQDFGRMSQEWGMDPADLLSYESRPDSGGELEKKGWSVWREKALSVAAGYGRDLSAVPLAMRERSEFLVAGLNG